ncbi:MAG: GntR family transcriptional regulator [Alkalilacustris sp.]
MDMRPQTPDPMDEGLLPKYHQVYLVLRQQIREGVYDPHGPLPAEKELSRLFGVSRITVRRALDRLEREGAIDRQRGRGTFLRAGNPQPHVAASLSGSIENLIAMGLRTEVRVLSLDYVPAPPDVGAALGTAPGTVVQRAVRVRSHAGVPFSHLTTWLPEEIGRTFDARALRDTPLLVLLDRAGVRARSAEQTITAKLAAPGVAEHLGLQPGEPVLSITRIVSDAGGRPVEFIRGLYRPDTYEHHMSIERVQQGGRPIWQG